MRDFKLRNSTQTRLLRVVWHLSLAAAFSSVLGEQDVPWTKTSDWFRPPPASEQRFGLASWLQDKVPNEFVYAIRPSLREKAMKLLADREIVPLSSRDCRELSCPGDVDRKLDDLIAKDGRLLYRMFNPPPLGRIPQHYTDETKRKIATEQRDTIARLQAEIAKLEGWRGRLHPLLAKAVALDESKSGPFVGFSAQLSGDALLIHHASEGDRSLPMENVPVVVFLPRKPNIVYRDASMSPPLRLPRPPKPMRDQDLKRPQDSIDVLIELTETP